MKKMVNGVEAILTQGEVDLRLAEEATEALRISKYESTVKYQDDRKCEYPTESDLIVAMWESLVEGDSTALDALQVKRLLIKAKYPKPE